MSNIEPVMNDHPPQTNQVFFEITGAILVSLMVTCLGITVTLFGQQLIPDWQASYLPVLVFLVSLERLFTYKQIKRVPVFSNRWFRIQFTQWVIILLVLKLIQLAARRPESLWMEIQLWRLDFGVYFLDTDFILSAIFIIVIWIFSGYFAGLLREMSLDETLIRYQISVVAPPQGPPARERLLNVIFGLGFLLVTLTALMRVNLRMLLQGETTGFGVEPLPYLAAGAWNVLLYFLLGLVLMSLSHFARLNARWRFQQLDVSPHLAGRWILYSLVFIALISLAASLLPTNYSLGLLNVLAYVLSFIFGILLYFFGVIWSLLIFIFNLLAMLFGRNLQGEESPAPQVFSPPELPDEILATGEPPWLAVLKSLIFWIVFLVVIGFSIYQFLRQHEGLLVSIRKYPVYTWLSRVWKWLKGGFKGFSQRITAAVETGIERIRSRQVERTARGGSRFINLHRLSPRQRVYFFFLAMIRRGGEQGLTRKGSQTPYEYAAALEDAIPEVDDEVASLTSAYVNARYSRSEVDDVQVGLVKTYWERIRGALRSFRR